MSVANPVTDSLPPPYAVCRLHLDDGRQVAGVWTGQVWWAGDYEVFPTHWAPVPCAGIPQHDDAYDDSRSAAVAMAF